MMSTFIKYLLSVLLIMTMGLSFSYGQQATRDQLLKLFYQANKSITEKDYVSAVNAYTEIIKLSPGLPDPYLQLGNLYADQVEDIAALKKACICYMTYMKLKPESPQITWFENKIEELQQKIAVLESEKTLISKKDTAVLKDSVFHEEVKEKLVVVIPDITLENEVSENDSDMSVIDSLPVTHSVSEPVKQVAAPDMQLSGRWVSVKLGKNGREFWIVEINSLKDKMEMLMEENSFALKDGGWNHKGDCIATAFVEKNDTLVFEFYSEEEKTDDTSPNNILGDFGKIVSNLFDSGMEKLNDFTSLSGKSSEHNGDSLLVSDLRTNECTIDSIADSLIVTYPKMIYLSEFRLQYDGYKLSGVFVDQVIERIGEESKILSFFSEPCVLIPAPDEYQGFVYESVSDVEKSSKRELRELLNLKMKDSGSSPSALNDVACMYASGIGIRKNMKMAVAYFMEASMKNNLFGMLNMAQLYREGLGVEKDLEKARDLYHRAYKSGYTDALVLCGDTYLEGAADAMPDYKNALSCYQNAMLRRCPFAAYRLGWLYREGLGVEQDFAKSWEYYQQALAMQYPDAMTDVGILYRDGIMTEKNLEKAYDFLLKAAQKGNARAMYELFYMYLVGDGVKPDFKVAKEWQLRFMEANDPVIEGYNTIKSKVRSILYPKSE